ncbi:uncharacterized protein DS421_4g132990 [Arachis hypogaea]|nr:uncharacterized protein DS421_4g132990 [Arachis hypogaea]
MFVSPRRCVTVAFSNIFISHSVMRLPLVPLQYVPMYMQKAVFKLYEMEFLSISDEALWPEWYVTRLRPNPLMRKKATGRLMSTRFRNDMDKGERQEKRCSLCINFNFNGISKIH